MQKVIENYVIINYKSFIIFFLLYFNFLDGNDKSQIKSEFLKDNKCGFFHFNQNLNHVEKKDKKLYKNFSNSFINEIRPQNNNQFLDTEYFRIHYALNGPNAVDPTDENFNDIPDFIDNLANAADYTYEVLINNLNYNKPPSDGWQENNGGSGAYDIYVNDLNFVFYGYTTPENLSNSFNGDNENSPQNEKNSVTSYIVINNDLESMNCENFDCVKTTFAHEFFHAIQLGYDSRDQLWFLEATATWVEDEVFDEINDNYQYLKFWMEIPHVALDKHRSPYWYGSWIFFRYISEHLGGPETIREIFNQSIVDDNSIDNFNLETIDKILKSKGSSFREILNKMSIANYLLTSNSNLTEFNYEEADQYREYGIEPHIHQSLGINSTNTLIEYFGPSFMHNSSHYINLSLNNEINNLEIDFSTLENSNMSAYLISNRTSNNLNIHRIRSSTPVPIYKGNNLLSIILTTDSVSYFDYHYSIKLKTDIKFPTSLYIDYNFPNPFNNFTWIRFFIPVYENISLSIIDINGRKVKDIPIDRFQVGYNELKVDTSNLTSGIYFFKLDGETNSISKKITLIK